MVNKKIDNNKKRKQKENNSANEDAIKRLIYPNNYAFEENLLFLFSSYIASNPNFKYNRTYLTDVIESFIQDVNSYRSEFIKISDILKMKILTISNSGNLTIYLDGIVKLKLENNMIKEDVDNSGKEISFRFDKMGEKRHHLNLLYKGSYGISIEHSYTIDLSNNQQPEKVIDKYFENLKNAIDSVTITQTNNDERK